MNERNLIASKLISSHIILPIGLCACTLFINSDAFLFYSITQSVIFILFYTGYWEFFGLLFKKIFFTAIEFILAAILISKFFPHNITRPVEGLIVSLAFVQLIILAQIVKIIFVICEHNRSAVEIEFPFSSGKFLITDGGNSRISRLMNYHFHSSVHKKKKTNRSMLYATDIVKLNGRSLNFLPLQNEAYPVFGEKIFSPVQGTIVKVENNIDDNSPFIGVYPYNTGNTVVIRQGNTYLLLGHLKKDSIKVQVGDSVNINDLIANAGNSGYSERPHLHMQLIYSETPDYWKGTGISIRYKSKNLYKNRLIKR